MDIGYILMPFATWLIVGSIKFIINSIKSKQLAFGLIGYGGLPSNHSAIVASVASLIAIREGISDPVFGVAITLAYIVVLDAGSLRRQVGEQAKIINSLNNNIDRNKLRERMGHSHLEIVVGIIVGILSAWMLDWSLSAFLI